MIISRHILLTFVYVWSVVIIVVFEVEQFWRFLHTEGLVSLRRADLDKVDPSGVAVVVQSLHHLQQVVSLPRLGVI